MTYGSKFGRLRRTSEPKNAQIASILRHRSMAMAQLASLASGSWAALRPKRGPADAELDGTPDGELVAALAPRRRAGVRDAVPPPRGVRHESRGAHPGQRGRRRGRRARRVPARSPASRRASGQRRVSTLARQHRGAPGADACSAASGCSARSGSACPIRSSSRRSLRADADPEARVLLAQVYALLQTLPADDRIAWTLRYVERHRLEVVAEIVGCSLATAKRRIRARSAS